MPAVSLPGSDAAQVPTAPRCPSSGEPSRYVSPLKLEGRWGANKKTLFLMAREQLATKPPPACAQQGRPRSAGSQRRASPRGIVPPGQSGTRSVAETKFWAPRSVTGHTLAHGADCGGMQLLVDLRGCNTAVGAVFHWQPKGCSPRK